jgi:hypothetical protein
VISSTATCVLDVPAGVAGELRLLVFAGAEEFLVIKGESQRDQRQVPW